MDLDDENSAQSLNGGLDDGMERFLDGEDRSADSCTFFKACRAGFPRTTLLAKPLLLAVSVPKHQGSLVGSGYGPVHERASSLSSAADAAHRSRASAPLRILTKLSKNSRELAIPLSSSSKGSPSSSSATV